MNTPDQIAAPQAWLAPLSGFIRERLGLHFPEDHWNDLHRGFLKATEAFGFGDPADCFRRLMQPDLPPKELHKLAGFLTIGETYFFREKNYFEPMARHLFGEVIERKRRSGSKQLRVWSAACSTGEEPYSIAMLLDAMLPDIDEWSIRILATDINPAFLERARAAVYRPWSFRGTPDWVRQRYFQIDGDNHTVIQEIRRRVVFDFLNLAEEVYPSLSTQTQAMDVIFCRNVLIYFSQEQARRVIGRLQKSLTEEGWLVLSPTETIYVADPVLHRQYIHDSILYQKSTTRPPEKTFLRPEPRPLPPLRRETPQFLKAAPRLPSLPPSPLADAVPARPAPAKAAAPPEPARSEGTPILETAQQLYAEGRHRETIELITRHLNGRPAQAREAFVLARAQANTGNLDEALQNALNAVETDKLAPDHHYLLAMIQLERNAAPEAERSLQRVIYLDDGHIMAFFSIGHLAKQQQRAEVARKHFRHALRLLEKQPHEDAVPEGDGMTVRRLTELIAGAMEELA